MLEGGIFQFITGADEALIELINHLGAWAYLVLFLMVFCESGLAPMVFMPGDGFIFTIGVIASNGELGLWIIFPVLLCAAVSGYFFNYYLGHKFGDLLLHSKKKRWINKEQLQKTEAFFQKYGSRAIFFGRFVPMVRTVIPFVGGIGKMSYRPFAIYSVVGGILWISLYFFGGFFLGGIPFVQENFLLLYGGLIAFTTLPASISGLYYWFRNR